MDREKPQVRIRTKMMFHANMASVSFTLSSVSILHRILALKTSTTSPYLGRNAAEGGLRDISVRNDGAVEVKRNAELPAARVCISMAAIIRK